MTYNEEFPPDKVGAVIVFTLGTDVKRVEEWIAKMQKAGHVESATVRKFHSPHGGPVFYIP